jgi:hypothetical protein
MGRDEQHRFGETRPGLQQRPELARVLELLESTQRGDAPLLDFPFFAAVLDDLTICRYWRVWDFLLDGAAAAADENTPA